MRASRRGAFASVESGGTSPARRFAAASSARADNCASCASSSGVVANTYSLMKHCCASAAANASPAAPTGLSATASASNAARNAVSTRSSARSRTGVARNRSMQQRIALGRRAAFRGEQLVGREPARPGGIGALHGLGERRQHRGERRDDAGKLVVKLRRERQRAGKARRGFGELALRLQHAAEIVQGLGMVGLERQQFLVAARGLVEPAFLLERRGLREQLAHGIAGTGGAPAGFAHARRGAACGSSLRFPCFGRRWLSQFPACVQAAAATCLTMSASFCRHCRIRRRGRVAEGGGLLNRYTLSRRIEGSNPSVSASLLLASRVATGRALRGRYPIVGRFDGDDRYKGMRKNPRFAGTPAGHGLELARLTELGRRR